MSYGGNNNQGFQGGYNPNQGSNNQGFNNQGYNPNQGFNPNQNHGPNNQGFNSNQGFNPNQGINSNQGFNQGFDANINNNLANNFKSFDSWNSPNWGNPHSINIPRVNFFPQCKKCHGSGMVNWNGTPYPCRKCYRHAGYCVRCYGTGRSYATGAPCNKCHGSGRFEKHHRHGHGHGHHGHHNHGHGHHGNYEWSDSDY